jgi:hypothetical protein
MSDTGKKTGITIGVGAALIAAFMVGGALGLLVGTKAWREGCIAELNFGLKVFKSDCSALALEGTQVDFANTVPLPLGAALQRIADMTSDKASQRIFLSTELLNAPFAKNIVHPPTGAQRSLTVIRQLLTEARAAETVDVCMVPNGYFLRVRAP